MACIVDQPTGGTTARRRVPRACVWLAAVAVACLLASPAAAQTIRDGVKDHVDKSLDKDKDKPKDKDKGKQSNRRSSRTGNSRPNPDSSTRSTSGTGETYTLTSFDDPELAANRGKLPKRIFPETLRLDLKLDAAFRGWLPQQYQAASVDVASYATWRVSLKGKFFKYISLHRGHYESNGLVAPRNKKASISAGIGQHSPKAAKALAYIGFPFLETWQPIIRYEAQSYNTTATPNVPVCIVDRDVSGSTDISNCPRTMGQLQMISSFETFVAGVRYASPAESKSFFATSKSKLPPLYVGLGVMSYNKPYQVNVDGDTLDDFLFDGIFRGLGLAFGTEVGGGPRRFFGKVDMQVGLGEVSLTNDLTLNEVAPSDWLIGYVQGNLNAGYAFVLYDGPPTIYFKPVVSAGGASFHFVKTKTKSGEMATAPNVNWDFLWSARAAIEFAL
jgi:hypothetical protein